MPKKVLVSGCFDLLHSGHIAFFEEASSYGDLHVAIGSDQTIYELKGKVPVYNQEERLYIVKSLRNVAGAFISQGNGFLDFIEEFKTLQPDIFVVNADGHSPEKEQLCTQYGAEYIVLQREPLEGLPPRSTTTLRNYDQMPFRIDLAGGWLDQPYVSKHHPGSVITISIEPTYNFNDRSGMASSTRWAAIDMWGSRLPAGDPEKLSKILFCYDNPPGTEVISGSQDSIGIVFPGLAKPYYDGGYWPARIERIVDESILKFVEESLYLVSLGPRHSGFDVLANTNINRKRARVLAEATERCWEAIKTKEIFSFGSALRASFEAQIAMFPNMINPMVVDLIHKYQNTAIGWKLSGAGGGGYLILVSDQPIRDAMKIVARRPNN